MEMCKCLGQPGRVPSSQTISILGSFFFFMVTFSVISDIPSSLSYALFKRESHCIKTYKTYYDTLL